MPTDKTAQRIKDDAAEVKAKIDASFEKLANKLRSKADRAKEHAASAKGAAKRKLHGRRFELYADAATELEERLSQRRDARDDKGD
ncbi:hypothetical protein [Methylobacterium oryzisoli]|uniref:hypothetical protein n=1 Tax=Methylobacterium oryzisoli TaxID=3385502 RepID=UPI003891BB14